jgi:hypothetical protein
MKYIYFILRITTNHWVYGPCASSGIPNNRQIEINIAADHQSSRLRWCQASIWWPWASLLCPFILIIFIFLRVVDEGRSPWRVDGSAVGTWCGASPALPCSDPSPGDHTTIFYSLKFQTPSTWRSRLCIYSSQEQRKTSYLPRHLVCLIHLYVITPYIYSYKYTIYYTSFNLFPP